MQPRRGLRVRERDEPLVGPGCSVDVAAGEVGLDGDGQQRPFDVVGPCAYGERAVDELDGDTGPTHRELQAGERDDGVVVVLESPQERLGVLQAALSQAQVRHPAERRVAQRRAVSQQLDGPLQLDLGGIPLTGGEEDAGVVGAAVTADGDEVPPPDHRLGGAEPLLARSTSWVRSHAFSRPHRQPSTTGSSCTPPPQMAASARSRCSMPS